MQVSDKDPGLEFTKEEYNLRIAEGLSALNPELESFLNQDNLNQNFFLDLIYKDVRKHPLIVARIVQLAISNNGIPVLMEENTNFGHSVQKIMIAVVELVTTAALFKARGEEYFRFITAIDNKIDKIYAHIGRTKIKFKSQFLENSNNSTFLNNKEKIMQIEQEYADIRAGETQPSREPAPAGD